MLLEAVSSGIDGRAVDEYWKAFSTAEGRRGMLELYRSLDFDELKPCEGRLAGLGVPALILWGQRDDYSRATTRRGSRARFLAPSSCCSTAPGISSSRTSRSAVRAS